MSDTEARTIQTLVHQSNAIFILWLLFNLSFRKCFIFSVAPRVSSSLAAIYNAVVAGIKQQQLVVKLNQIFSYRNAFNIGCCEWLRASKRWIVEKQHMCNIFRLFTSSRSCINKTYTHSFIDTCCDRCNYQKGYFYVFVFVRYFDISRYLTIKWMTANRWCAKQSWSLDEETGSLKRELTTKQRQKRKNCILNIANCWHIAFCV